MPKEDIDYSNTIIYKIFCKDPFITDVYVGHTTNFTQRKHSHKIACNSTTNKLKIYNIIRQNGGWNNWEMTEIAKYNCKDHTEARIKEQEFYNMFNSSLNSKPPYDKKYYYCNICNLECKTLTQFNNHNKYNKHNNNAIISPSTLAVDGVDTKSVDKFICEKCEFKCSRSCDWNRHILTTKHKEKTDGKQLSYCQSVIDIKKFKCGCGKEYTCRQGLWKHRKICDLLDEYNNKNKNEDEYDPKKLSSEELFMTILKDNQEFKQMLIDQNNKIMELASAKNTTVITNTNNTTNNNNFNLQMFLNVQCKDALNITEFVESLQPKIEDLEATGRLGYVEGISQIFLNGLQGLDINKRPIHCSDQKRETIYIKDNNVWEKEGENREKLKLAIKTVASKNIKQISNWQKQNPDCFDSSSKKNDQYLRIVSNSMNGLTPEETQKNYDKIISKLAKEVVIQKVQI